MKQSILKHGDLVKCIGLTQLTSDLGFQLDGLYSVATHGPLIMVIGPKGNVSLTDDDSQFNDHALDFTKHQCPIVLPRGI